MKTEQEQIEQMITIFKNNREVCQHTCCIKCKYCDDEDCMYSSCAYSLYRAGYGDVSEYKAEIERLKAENDSLNKKISELEQDLIHADENVFYRECDVKLAEDKIKKQAKIDILNKVKEKLDSAPNGWAYTGYIDDLIEEVENEN